MSALDVASDEDLEARLRVELNGRADWDKDAAFLRVCVGVSRFISCAVWMMVVGCWELGVRVCRFGLLFRT